jgi:hypothetical protein
MGVGGDAAVADDDVGAALQDRLDKRGDVAAVILVIGVGVDDDVGALGQRPVEPRAEGRGKPAVGPVLDDVADAEAGGNLGGGVAAAVVDDQIFDLVDAFDRLRLGGDGRRQMIAFVEARNLDDQLHWPPRLPIGTVCDRKWIEKPLTSCGLRRGARRAIPRPGL